MSHDDDDDDFVVPSGTRRSSYVPPVEPGDYIPALPEVPEQTAPTSSTGPVPTIGSAGDDSVAQTPIFAESVDVPRVDSEPTGSIIIEVPAEDLPVVENSLDQFGLPVVADPIDIPTVVISDPLPDAVAGTGAVFDDNRMFPPAVSPAGADVEPVAEPVGESVPEVIDGPIVEIVDVSIAEVAVEPLAEEIEVNPIGEVFGITHHGEPLPERQSLTPEQLSEMLGAHGGMSSNDQMALLDSQIPLREADAAAISRYLSGFEGSHSSEAQSARAEARERFGDLVPDLLPDVSSEFVDDTTPVTGIPIVEHVEIVEVFEDEAGDVVGVAVTEIDEVVVAPESPAPPQSPSVPADDQAWSLSAPADVVSDETPSVSRRHWWSIVAIVASVAAVLLVSAGVVVAQSGSAPGIVFVLAGIAAAVPIVEFARRGSSVSGSSWRVGIENVLGRSAGRTASVLVAVLTLVTLVAALLGALDGLGHELESSTALGSLISGALAPGSTSAALVALVLLASVLSAALPHRIFRAKTLVLAGLTAVGTGSVVVMGSMLLALTPSETLPTLNHNATVAGIAASSALVMMASVLFGFHEVSRVRETRSGILWLSIGLGFGGVVLAGTVAAALLAPQGTHYFFGSNPVLHIIAPSPLVNVALGAAALVPAVVFVSSLTLRFIGAITTRDDREDSNIVLRWLLVLVPFGIGAVAYLGVSDVVTAYLPSLTTLATPIAAVLGVLAARGIVGRDVRTRAAKRGLAATVIVTTVLGLGFGSSDGVLFEWVGFINSALRPLGYGLLYIDSAAPLATAFLALLIGLIIVLPSTRRSARSA